MRVPDRQGQVVNVIRRLPDLRSYEDRLKNPYLGATVGRYARCIANGRFWLDGVEYRLDQNYGRHHIHGGSLGFDRYVWDAEAGPEGDELVLGLRLHRPDGDQGYPGAISAETVYRAGRDGRLTFDHKATTTAPTIVDLTNHASWNLFGSGTIDEHQLAINAAQVLMVDEELIPAGRPVSVSGSGFDFSTARALSSDRVDNCFVLSDPRWAAELFEPRSGRVMRIWTDQPGLQVYSCDAYAEPRSGLCLQTGSWPDSPNHVDFPSSRLDPGQTYRHRTRHEFSWR